MLSVQTLKLYCFCHASVFLKKTHTIKETTLHTVTANLTIKMVAIFRYVRTFQIKHNTPLVISVFMNIEPEHDPASHKLFCSYFLFISKRYYCL